MKKVFWWTLGLLLSPVLLFVILAITLYLPPVQNWVVDKVAAYASEETGMQISIDHVALSFPLDLAVDNVSVIKEQDTVADVKRAIVDVQLLPLLTGKVVVNELEVTNTRLNTSDLIAAARIKGQFARLFVTSRGIDLGKETVELNGTRLENARLDIQLNDSVPEDTTKSENRWRIHVDEATIAQSEMTLHMPGDSMSVHARMGELKAHEAWIDLGTETYTVERVDWTKGTVRYDQNHEPATEGLDLNHIELTDIDVGIDSIYYHDPTLRLQLRTVSMKEKSGLEINNVTGAVIMDDGIIKLPQMKLTTPDGLVDVALDMPLSLTDDLNPGSMQLRLDAQLGKQTLLPFLEMFSKEIAQQWPNQPLSVSGTVRGNMQHMKLDDIRIALAGAFRATASGVVARLDNPKKLDADVKFMAQTQNLNFLMTMLPHEQRQNLRLPPISAQGSVRAHGGQYSADITAHEGKGTIKAKGSINADIMRYNADVSIHDLNIHHFMPNDSIYTVSADVTANGQGTDFLSPKTTMEADATIHQLGYGQWSLDNITAKARVKNGHAIANIDSRNPLVNGRVCLDALLNTRELNATVTADVNKVDLQKMLLTEDPLSIGLCGHIDLTSDMKLSHSASGLISDIILRDSSRTFREEFIGLHLKTDADTVLARIQSGDFIVMFDASGDYERLFNQLSILGDSATAQIDKKTIDQPALRQLLPTMKLHVESKQDNPIAALLKNSQGVDVKEMVLDMTTSVETGVNGNGYIHALTVSDMRLDTINFQLTQRKHRLSFGGQIRNNKRNPQFVFNALFDGVLQERGATMGVRVYNAEEKMGLRLGMQAEVVDSGYKLRLMPERPTLGFKEFNLNKDNFVFLGRDNRVRAKIDLIADDGTGMKVYSNEQNQTVLQDLTVSLHKINLNEMTAVIPYAPRMAGVMNGDYHIVQDAEGHISVVSEMAVRNMAYEGSPIGHVSTELMYLQKEDDTHAVMARLMKDDEDIVLLDGTYYDAGEGSLDVKMQLTQLPLSMANGFIADQLFALKGYADGELSVQGPLSRPLVNGEILLSSSTIESDPYGVTLRLDDDPVRIVNSNLLLDNLTLYAYNKNPLNIQGNVDFSDLDRIMMDVRMKAQNFQIIGTKEHAKSVAYGKAFVDIYASMQGPLSRLNMRGRLNVLGTTDVSYILRDTPLTTDNQLEALVKFTDFTDTTQTVIERPALTGFRMDMTVDVSKGAHIIAYLNTDHSNYIDLLGGGTLRMLYSPADNLQLTGRYTLLNGEMKYALPIIPLKTFTIQDGSYVEFTGQPMNPTLNITATERTRATVTGSNGVARSVDFDCGVQITKTLSDMGLQFTLDAPEDMQLHSELQSMGAEQRGKLAVTMLTTGMYLADGNTKPFSMNSALSSFLSSEISSLTGNALRTLDLSFGLDNSTDASGESHTDYSFKFSKRFLNNRLKVIVGGKVTSGADMPGGRNQSFFDNVSMEYRLDDSATKYLDLFFENNSYDWLDGYTQKYGGGFIWRRTLQKFTDIFRFKDLKPQPFKKTDTHETK